MLTVSILIPTYNQTPDYLAAAVSSALWQTHPCQIIVVDDGSEPRQEEIIKRELHRKYGPFYDNDTVQYVWQENRGVAGALNRALELATGDYIQWLPSDDVYTQARTELMLKHLLREEAVIGYSAWEDGLPGATTTWPAPCYPTQMEFFEALKRHCFVNAATVMWHRLVFQEVGIFDTNMVHAQDYEFLLRCAEKHNFLGVNEPLVRRRRHEKQMLNTLREPQEAEKKRRDMEYIRQRYGASGNVWLPEKKDEKA